MGKTVELPQKGTLEHQEKLEELGFVFLEDEVEEEGLLKITLPVDWIFVTGALADPHGRTRARTNVLHGKLVLVWFKAIAVEDKYSQQYDDSSFDFYVHVSLKGKTIYYSKKVRCQANERHAKLKDKFQQAREWLDQNYPDWRSPFAYWD